MTGGVRAWQARKIAEHTRALSWEACADVDHALSDLVGMLPWPRFVKILTAAILDADPALAAERAQRARAAQDVFAFDSEDGLKTIVAKANAGDAIWFMAAINRIADILAARGDTDPIGVRRARAVGILAQPAEALQLLLDHQHDPEPDTPGQTDKTGEPAEAAEPADAATPEDDLDAGTVDADATPEPEFDDDDPEPEPEPEPEADEHQSVSLRVPPGFTGKAARPRVVLHFHLSEAALRSGHAIVRPDDGGPLTLDQLVEFLGSRGCQIRIQPVFDPTEVAGRRLRNTGPAPRRGPNLAGRRRLPLRHLPQHQHRP